MNKSHGIKEHAVTTAKLTVEQELKFEEDV